MAIINVTAADIAKGENLEAGWYGIECIRVKEPAPSKKGTTLNYVFIMLVEGEKGKGKELEVLVNSTMLHTLKPMYEAFMYPAKFEPTMLDTDIFIGKTCDAKIGQRQYEGRLIDEIVSYVPYGVGKTMKSPFGG